MKNIQQLEVRLADKTFSVNGKNMRLDNSLFKADRSSKENVDYLELRYQNYEEGFVEKEAENIYKFLEKQELDKTIEVSPCPEYPEGDYPTVTLYGKFSATVIPT